MCIVVPPNAAEVVPEVKSSQVTVPPNGISMWVWGSIAPGITYLPPASITRSASPSSEAPIAAMVSPSIRMSPTKSSTAVMMWPPLISTLMVSPLSLASRGSNHTQTADAGASTELIPARR